MASAPLWWGRLKAGDWAQHKGRLMKKRLLPFLLAGALTAGVAAPAAAQTDCGVEQDTAGGAAGLAALIAAAVQANVPIGINACAIEVDVLNDSLNNLLQNADIRVLNNSLNNLLRNSDIIDDVTVVVNVLTGVTTIDVDLLSGGDFTITLVDQ